MIIIIIMMTMVKMMMVIMVMWLVMIMMLMMFFVEHLHVFIPCISRHSQINTHAETCRFVEVEFAELVEKLPVTQGSLDAGGDG